MEDNYNLKELLKSWWFGFKDFFNEPLFTLANNEFNLGSILYLLLLLWLLLFVSKQLMKFVVKRVFSRTEVEKGMLESIATLVRFGILIIGTIVILQSAGIDLSTLSILAGALGVGIGFGLQGITNNFISGLVILFEGPVKVGDRIEVGEITGDVVNIKARATTVVTNDNISVIISNSEFINGTVINWSHHDRNVRFLFPVGVSYKEDPEKVLKILLEVAMSSPNVLKLPGPIVVFDEFGDSSLNFFLGVWTSTYIEKSRILKSEAFSRLYFEIFKKFSEHGIEIPFPQRDLHIKTSPIPVEQIRNGEN